MHPVQAASLKVGEFPGSLIATVRLDGVEQRAVQEIGDGWLVRGARCDEGETPPAGYKRTRQGYLFGCAPGAPIDTWDFLLERVEGRVEVEWNNKQLARRWLELHGLAPADYGC